MSIKYLAAAFGLAATLGGGCAAWGAGSEKDRLKTAYDDTRRSCPFIPGENTSASQLTRHALQRLAREGYTPVAGGMTTPIPRGQGETPLMMMIAAPLVWMVRENGDYILLQSSPDGTALCYRINGKGWEKADAQHPAISEEERMIVPSFKDSQRLREQVPKQAICGERDAVLNQMRTIHGETPVFQGVNKDGALDIVTYDRRTGKFTYLISHRIPTGQKPRFCTRAFGDSFKLG